MNARIMRTIGPVAVLIAACSRPQQTAVAPQPATDTTTRVAAAAAPAPRDTTPAVDPARARADSVRAQILRDSVAAARRAESGLPPEEDSVLVAVIRFGYDSAVLDDSARALLTSKVQVLRRNDRLRIEIAGHADERGSDEYNLALGLRRAAAAKQFLTAYGVEGDRVSIVSFGEERPLDTAANEDAWARNRRGEFQPQPPAPPRPRP
jgi:peptidoglycan-associated lipoprotein